MLVKRTLFCPWKKTSAQVEIVQRFQEPDKLVRVKACSLLTPRNRVDCDQACIHQAG